MSTVIPEQLERGQLRYERISEANAEELRPLLMDPRVGATLWPTPEPPAEHLFQAWLARAIDHWQRHGWGPWLLRDPAAGEMVGRGGLQHTEVEGEPTIEVGWAIVPERWGQGLATELANTSVQFGFESLELDELVAFTLPHNLASRRVMEKSGFTYRRDIVHVSLPHVLYARGRA